MCIRDRLKGEELRSVFWMTDNANVEKFLSKGSSKPDILHMAVGIIETAKECNLDIVPVWTRRTDPRVLKADCGTKGFNSDDWCLPGDVLEALENRFGCFSIDLFGRSDLSNYSPLLLEILV